MSDEIKNMTGEDLVSATGHSTIGTPNGARAQEAQAELTRRLMVSMDKLGGDSSRYSKIIIGLTIVLGILAVIQIVLFLR